MPTFSATTDSEAVVAADREAIWAALTDPVLLPKLTPLLRSIETERRPVALGDDPGRRCSA